MSVVMFLCVIMTVCLLAHNVSPIQYFEHHPHALLNARSTMYTSPLSLSIIIQPWGMNDAFQASADFSQALARWSVLKRICSE